MVRSRAVDKGLAPLLLCGLAPAMFLVAILVQDVLRPGYDPVNHWGSELSNGDWGWVQVTNFIATGLLTMVFAVGVRRALVDGPGARAIPALTGILGFCLVVGGVFSTDPHPGFPPGAQLLAEPTLHSWIHDGNLPVAWTALTAAILVTAYRSAKRREGWAWTLITVAAGVLTPVTLYIATRHFDMTTLTGSGHGVWQRASQAIGFGWYALLSGRLLRSAARGRAGHQLMRAGEPAGSPGEARPAMAARGSTR